MSANGGVYAVKKRKKPVQKNVKAPPVKSNPSKRHRDRLNVELDHLTSLLPFSEEVRGRLDKLSVLRLSVGYIKVKSYFHATLPKRSAPPDDRVGQLVALDGVSFTERELLLKALNGFVLVVTSDGTLFYASPTIKDFLGFDQSDVVQQDVYNLIHMDDREMFRCQLHFSLNPGENDSDAKAENGKSSSKSAGSLLPQHIPPENSSFLERSFCCRLRCLLDNTSGFMALNFNGRLKYLHMQGKTGAGGKAAPPQLALFAVATPVEPPSVMEIRTKTLIFQSKHRMDFAPVGIDTRGKLVLGYSEVELVTPGSGYQFIHAADMMYCADNHLRMIKTGDSGFTFFRLLTKTGHWLWVQATARVVFKEGRPDFIIARQKAITNEEGEEHFRQRRRQLPFNISTGVGVLYNTWMDAVGQPSTTDAKTEETLKPASLLGSLRWQDHSVYTQPQKPSPQLPVLPELDDLDLEQPQSSLEQAFMDSHALLSVPSQTHTSKRTTIAGDAAADAMIESLEQILRDIGGGEIEGLEVDEAELRDWENALVRMNNERAEASEELNSILASDVFSYVEEALRRETSGLVQGLDRAEARVSENSSAIQGQHHVSLLSNNEPPQTDYKCAISEQAGFADVLCDVGSWTEQRDVSHRVAHTQTQCENTHQGHTSRLWPPCSSSSSTHHCGGQTVSSAPCYTDHSRPGVTPPSRLLSVQNSDSNYSWKTGHTTQNGLNHTHVADLLQSPSAWQQQQLPQNFQHHALTQCSHTPGSSSTATFSHQTQIQPFSGSCMYEKRESHMLNGATVPARQNGPPLGPAHVVRATLSSPFTQPHHDMAPMVLGQGMLHSPGPHMASCADVGNISLVHLNGDGAGLGTARSDYPPENGSLQSPFYCWNGEAQHCTSSAWLTQGTEALNG